MTDTEKIKLLEGILSCALSDCPHGWRKEAFIYFTKGASYAKGTRSVDHTGTTYDHHG